jgi:hypothetical protein
MMFLIDLSGWFADVYLRVGGLVLLLDLKAKDSF